MYVPVAQAGDAAVAVAHLYFQVSWVVRADHVTSELTRRMRDELRAVDPHQPITAFRTMDDIKASQMSTETFQMTLLTTFAAIGLLLATAGIYGLVAYSVTQRTREFGIRVALGATRRDVMASVLRQAILLAGAGVAAGSVASVALTRTLQTLLFGVSTLDVATFVVVAVVLVVVALLASVVPAVRAVRLNPVTALRE
jgi:putative ABC transport system permease protein